MIVDSYKELLIRRLKVKSREVSEELSATKSFFDIAALEFSQAVTEYCKDHDMDNPLLSLKKEDKQEKKDLNQEFKSVFRKIAFKTHSDTSKTEDTRDTLEKAVEAKKENNLVDLIGIAQDLKLDISSLDFSSIRDIESSIKEKENEINQIHNSFPWVWYHSSKSKKVLIIKQFLSMYV